MKRILYITCLVLLCLTIKAQKFPFRYLSPITISPSEETNCMYFDKEGLMWVGTNAGVKSYDGYQMKTYKSSAFRPGILPNNAIRSITEDRQNNIWLGTRNGLARMNKKTGEFKSYFLAGEDQRIIYTLTTTKDGTMWIGTDGGLTYFDARNETFHTYNKSNASIIDETGHEVPFYAFSVKAILEDHNGDLLIGTWSSGLFRFNRKTRVFRQYPKLNERNSAYSLFFDKHHRLWVGTWGYGVVRIDNPNDVRNAKLYQYPYKTNYYDTFYKIIEDPITQSLWACTREGVCYIDENNPNTHWTQYTQIGDYPLNYNNDIATDGTGNIWLCTQNFGIMQLDTSPSPFTLWNLDTKNPDLTVSYIYSLSTTDGENFWMGLNPYGLAKYNRKSHTTLYNQAIPGFQSIPYWAWTTSISNITQRSNGELWFASNNYGIIVKPANENAKLLNVSNTPYLIENFVNTFFESRDKTLWIGQRKGMSLVYPDNHGASLTMQEDGQDFSSCDIRHIMQDKKGNIWVSTDNEGIIRISGNPKHIKSLQYKQYNPKHHNFDIDDATACLEDKRGRLWAISNSGGLFLYNKVEDRFEPKNRTYLLPGDRALSIQDDSYGNLWLTTDKALVHLVWKGEETTPANITYFTKEDGLGDILFAANTTCKYKNELFFGSRTSFFSFVPTPTTGLNNKRAYKLIITDLLIDDVPFAQLDSVDKRAISQETPAYTHLIRIPARIKKFGIEFSLLTYGNALKNVYAYRLEGYDEDWKYTNGETHKAMFQNLPSGTYYLHVKATDSYGHWQELPYAITIKILPPWYASRLAYMAYILLFIGSLLVFARWYKEYLKTKNRLQMGVILTNITHELLTPLTVISATIYKLKKLEPKYEEDYQVMDNNINRTTRLLRQILEVRKSQAGQLKLLVTRNDLCLFVQNVCESIQPMAAHEGIQLSLQMPPHRTAWFDADKLEKILYNLLSNAIKYNKKEGSVKLTLTLTHENATFRISDTGIGMSKKKLKNLYTRFFDGDYRKQKQPGTGIGLSLTHDLVKLHHGNIHCKSTEGKGTTFTVIIPIQKQAYQLTEIDASSQNRQANKQTVELATQKQQSEQQEGNPAIQPSTVAVKNLNKVLIVEDNEELLDLMQKMLSKNYQIFTAKNGKQAMAIITKKQLDLVVSDVMMPVMDGIELTKRIKEDKGFWQLPVILLTAKNKEEDKMEGYAVGADAYITKPFKFEDLEVRISTLISNRQKIREKFEKEQSQEIKEEPAPHYSNPDQAFVERATELVMQHLADAEYDREVFAKDMALGSSTLYKRLKAATGLTVIEFINSIRLKEAARILQSNPGIMTTDLAIRVGFNTPKYFSKCFKKEFGVYPKEYLEQSMGGNEAEL